MARPMVLMQSEDLIKLYQEYSLGVPIAKLKVKYDIELTEPTLKKLIKYYEASEQAIDEAAKAIILKSLFPKWLAEIDTKGNRAYTGYYQPNEWFYTGTMPIGEWKRR